MVGVDASVVVGWLVEDDEAQPAHAQNLFETAARAEWVILIDRAAVGESTGATRRRVSPS
jgi:predicted nucleic-acid-binding protein